MPPRAAPPKPTRSILVVPSRVGNAVPINEFEAEGVQETEIAAQISVPAEGGWGWVVVTASFFCIFILDGVFFTFGSIFHDMSDDLKIEESLIALMNSIAIAIYFIGGPLVSSLINRFGFRACTMCGSILCSLALLCSYFALGYVTLLLAYGIVGGFGACLISMSSGLVVGFYFERLRSLTMAIASIGSSVGIMIMFTINTYLVQLAGWRVTMLLHSGLLGITYFLGMTFRPLLSLTVTKAAIESVRTVTYLPSLAVIKSSSSRTRREGIRSTATERLFSAVSNAHFPTAAAVVEEGVSVSSNQPGPSTAAASRITLTAHGPQGGISRRQLKQVQSIISKTSVLQDKDKEKDKEKANIELNVQIEEHKKRKWWQKLCHWEEHVQQSRPMYRDDAFYEGRLDKLPEYQKSRIDTAENKTGLEYQMAVSRAVTAADLNEKRGIFTTAVRRVLATMMDPKLLKRLSFRLLCTSGFFTYLGYLVPYIFLPDRNKLEGIDPSHCSLFVSVIGFANAMGRLVIGALACKFCPLKLYWIASILAGVGIILFNFSFNVYYQYVSCAIFGFFIASLSSIRGMVIVNLYGLDMLTNGTGVMILFQGLGSLISTPLSSILKNNFGYAVSFYVAGFLVIISGIVLLPVQKINDKERAAIIQNNNQ